MFCELMRVLPASRQCKPCCHIALARGRRHADVDEFAEDPSIENIQDLFTVEMIVNDLDAEL